MLELQEKLPKARVVYCSATGKVVSDGDNDDTDNDDTHNDGGDGKDSSGFGRLVVFIVVMSIHAICKMSTYLINKPISGCVPIACDGLVTTSLLLADLLQVDCQNLLSTGLLLQVI